MQPSPPNGSVLGFSHLSSYPAPLQSHLPGLGGAAVEVCCDVGWFPPEQSGKSVFPQNLQFFFPHAEHPKPPKGSLEGSLHLESYSAPSQPQPGFGGAVVGMVVDEGVVCVG